MKTVSASKHMGGDEHIARLICDHYRKVSGGPDYKPLRLKCYVCESPAWRRELERAVSDVRRKNYDKKSTP